MKEETLEESKQTLEEAADIDSKNHYKDQSDYLAIGFDSFKRGAKWQAERMYDVLENLWLEYRTHTNNEDAWSFKEWLVEQFKKK